MKKERLGVDFPMWRKKVDDSLLNRCVTPIPDWLSNIWDIQKFSTSSKKDKASSVIVNFHNVPYQGYVTLSNGKRRLFFDQELGSKLKETFLMSYVNSIEKRISQTKEDQDNWEFLDIEFNSDKKEFYFTAHYTSKVKYPYLFKELVDSSILKSISNKLDNKDFAIVKSEWKEKEKLSKELDRKNVIYNLIDINKFEFYIGEAQSLKERLNATRKEIPSWTHYRFDVLPDSFGQKERLAIERLLIKTFSSVMPKESNSSIRITEKFELKNKKIDR